MILYKKDGKEFLLMSNNSRGVMKIPTADFGTAPGITAKVTTPTGGIAYETIASMTGVEQMDQLDAQRSIVLARRRRRPQPVGGRAAVTGRGWG